MTYVLEVQVNELCGCINSECIEMLMYKHVCTYIVDILCRVQENRLDFVTRCSRFWMFAVLGLACLLAFGFSVSSRRLVGRRSSKNGQKGRC